MCIRDREKSVQYESVMAFGKVQVIQDFDEKREKLNGLLQKYFGEMDSGTDYRPITDKELKQTSVYRIKIDHWSGKRNWPERTDQAEEGEWPDLDPKWFEFY